MSVERLQSGGFRKYVEAECTIQERIKGRNEAIKRHDRNVRRLIVKKN